MTMADVVPSVLDRATPDMVRTDPFPHIVLDDALPQTFYERLASTIPPFRRIAWDGNPPSNRRFFYGAWLILMDLEIGAHWHDFCRRHTDPAFLDAVATLFGDHMAAHNPALPNAIEEAKRREWALYRPVDAPSPTLTQADARIEINTPVTGSASVVRGGHVDVPNRLFSGLLYMRAPDDDSTGGDLILYRYRGDRRPSVNDHEMPEDQLEPVVTVPYAANRLVLFPNSRDALHGVSARDPTPHTRRYVFITAEIDRDLFD